MCGKKNRFLVIWGLVIILSASGVLWGCGRKTMSKEEILATMKEFSVPMGSAFIHMDQDWNETDLGFDTLMMAQSSDGREGMFLFQFPKGAYTVDSMEAVKAFMENNYQMKEAAADTAIAIPGMTNVEVISCFLSAAGDSIPAYMAYGETEYAYYALGYVANKIDDARKNVFQVACSTFREEIPAEKDATTVKLTDTVRWFNASYAVLTEINGWDYNRFAGLPANDESKEVNQKLLEQWWEVTDRPSAEEMLDWLLSEGHRSDFIDDMKYLEECGLSEVAAEGRLAYVLANFELSQETAKRYVDTYAIYEQYGENAITGWDYCRAMNLLGFCYLAGYYTEQESLDQSLETARTIQQMFGSWDELIESYMRGYEYWTEESADDRRQIYEELKSRDDNPYAVDFKTTLEKTW